MSTSTNMSSVSAARRNLLCILVLLTIALVSAANASSTGISGYSGKTAGKTCNSCHVGGNTPTVVITGPTSVVSGSTNMYTLQMSGGQMFQGGLDVATTAGTIAATDPLTQIMKTELTHNTPKSADASGNISWVFNWTAPTVTASTSVTMYGDGNSTDGSGDTGGDAAAVATLAITVNPSAPAPTLSATPSSLSFAFTIGGTAPAAKSVAIASSGTALSYTVASSATWLTASAASGTTPGSINITANPAGLAAGTFTGNITITSTGASNSPQTVPVTFVVSPAAVKPTLSATPSSLSFAFTIGGTAPAAKSVAIASSGTALSYTVASSATWLTASTASGTTPGSINITANPAGLAAGTYTGNITITSSGASNSPQTVPVTFVVSPAAVKPTLSATPSSLSFAFTIGGTAPAAKSVAIASSGTALSYTVASSATWLTASAASGTTPGSINITANPAGLAAGTFTGNVTITSTGASNSPQTVPVTFVVSAAAVKPTLSATPSSLSFAFTIGGTAPAAKSVAIASSGTALSYTVASSATWLTASAASGTTPGSLTVSAKPANLAAGTYTGSIKISATGVTGATVAVTLTVSSAQGDNGGSIQAQPTTYDPNNTHQLTASWVRGAGVPEIDNNDSNKTGLMLVKTSPTATKGSAGAIITGVAEVNLGEIGFDVAEGGHCTAKAPRFVITTTDDVVHTIAGCALGTVAPTAPSLGWKRVRFDVAKQATPAINPTSTIKTIGIVLDEGPDAPTTKSGMVVLDNIDVNGKLIEKGKTNSDDGGGD